MVFGRFLPGKQGCPDFGPKPGFRPKKSGFGPFEPKKLILPHFGPVWLSLAHFCYLGFISSIQIMVPANLKPEPQPRQSWMSPLDQVWFRNLSPVRPICYWGGRPLRPQNPVNHPLRPVRAKKNLFPRKLRKTILDSAVTFFFRIWDPFCSADQNGPYGASCLLAC